MSIHEGHRERMRKQLKTSGMDSLSDVQVLEMLLYYAAPRGDTNPAAHALLKRFGTLDGVFSAPETELRKIDQRVLRCPDFEPQVDLFADADARGVGAPGQGRRGRLARGSPRERQDEQDGENLAQQIIACGNNRVIFLHSLLWCLC